MAFAGTAVIKCPLTLDYGFFHMALTDISPSSVSRGGTLIGDAIRKAVDEVFDERQKEHRDLILITDGEDHESFPVEAAKMLGEQGIRLIAIGLGDEDQGRRIPITRGGRKTFLQYDGQEIWSKLDASTLRQMVNATPGGRYLNVATGAIDLGDVYVKLIASAEKTELGRWKSSAMKRSFRCSWDWRSCSFVWKWRSANESPEATVADLDIRAATVRECPWVGRPIGAARGKQAVASTD